MKWYHAAAIAAGALVALSGTAAAGYAAHSQPARIITRTVHTPPTVITRTVHTPAKVIIRKVPGPVRTVTGAPDMTCITALYQNIASWKAANMPPPNGWWDARCPTPATSAPQAATVPSASSTPVSGDPVAGTGTGAPCTTAAGYFPGGLAGHEDATGFCVPNRT
jgi:hypothetical protein